MNAVNGMKTEGMNTAHWNRAFQLAMEVHSNQFKKGTTTPLLYHPLAVASWVLKCGGTEDQAIGALLHDAAAERPALCEQIQMHFDPVVMSVIEAFRDPIIPGNPEPTWRESKMAYVDKLWTLPPETLLVIACEELHELSEWVIDYSVDGMDAFKRLQGANRMEWFWYYKECLRVFMKTLSASPCRALISEYAARLKKFQSVSLPV